MASTRNIAALSPNRKTGNRLVFVVIGATLLVTLPVLPLRFLGIPGPDLPPDIAHFAKNLIEKMGYRPTPAPTTVTVIEKPETVTPAEVSAMAKAEETLVKALEGSPNDADLNNQLGLLYASAGDFDKAAIYLQKAVDSSRVRIAALTQAETTQSNSEVKATEALLERTKISVNLAAAHSSLARVYDQIGKHDKVLAELEQANNDIGFGVSSSTLPAKLAQLSPGTGAASAASHKLSEQVMNLLARGEGLMQAKRYGEALDQYKKIVEIDPLAALAHHRLGQLAAMNNNNYLALQELKTAVKLEPDDAKLQNDLAIAYRNEGNNELAIEHLEKALSIDPKSTDAAFNLGNLLCTAGKLKQAEVAFQRLVQTKPDSSMAHNNLATVKSMNGDYTGAVTEFQEALRYSPNVATTHYGLGCALYNLNKYPASIREFRTALALNPGLTDAQAKIQQAVKKNSMSGMATGVN